VPRVSVIIVTYRSVTELPACIESLLRQSVPIEIFLVDNASPDETPKLAAEYASRHENIHAILNRENVGLAAGNNVPLGKCRGDYVLALNPDTVLCQNSLERMVDYLDRNPDVGVLGPKNLYADGTPHVSAHRDWGLMHVLIWRVLPYRFSRQLHDELSTYKSLEPLFVSGACLLIRREIYERIGGYDPEYFLTIEDVCDLCIRAKRSGCRVVFLPEAEIFHFTGRSGVQAPYIVVWHGNRGTVYHFLKHKGILQALLVSLLLIGAAAARVAVASILSIAKRQYRDVARIYAKVLWNLIVENPIRSKSRGVSHKDSHRSEKQADLARDGAPLSLAQSKWQVPIGKNVDENP